MTFWGGSGYRSSDPCLWLMDPEVDLDPAIFVTDLKDTNQKRIQKKVFLFITFLKDKKSKRSHNTIVIKFSYFFCLMIELIRIRIHTSIHLTNGSGYGSGRPKNMWFRLIRIRNNALHHFKFGENLTHNRTI
jgi:hypothetical protein